MNIGLDHIKNQYCIFLNAGDILVNPSTISDLKKFAIPGVVNAFPVLNKTCDGILFRRPSNIWMNSEKNFNLLRKFFYNIFYNFISFLLFAKHFNY